LKIANPKPLIPSRPPLEKGGVGGFGIENFAMLILQFACLPQAGIDVY